jgi:predicted SnoaL-like aldol condensation-catalyzing enzyme
MQQARNSALVRRIYDEILNLGELHLADEIIHGSAVDHAPSLLSSLPITRAEDLKAFVHMMCTAFPDVYWEIGEIITTDSTVVIRTELTGTHLGDFHGIPATGDIVRMTVIDIVRIVEGKIAEHWGTLPPLDLNGRPLPVGRSARQREETESGP